MRLEHTVQAVDVREVDVWEGDAPAEFFRQEKKLGEKKLVRKRNSAGKETRRSRRAGSPPNGYRPENI